MLKIIKENKGLKLIYNIGYWLLVLVAVMILLVVALQRFSNNTIAIGGLRMFNISSGSMVPKYEVGDIIISIEKDISEIEVGDDVVYKGEKGTFAGKIVTHQVIEIEQEEGKTIFTTKGLANEEEDPKITEDQIIGVVVYKVYSFSFIAKTINNLYSFYFIIFLPIVIIIFIEIRRVVAGLRKDKNETIEEPEDEEENNTEE